MFFIVFQRITNDIQKNMRKNIRGSVTFVGVLRQYSRE